MHIFIIKSCKISCTLQSGCIIDSLHFLLYFFSGFSKQLQVYNKRKYNRFPMRPLG
ncbi:hypothetical protein GPK85_02130 [Roseburia hominis]|nr:hypothetical protein [Roseburia hominis]